MDLASIRDYFTGLQDRIVGALERVEGSVFLRDAWDRPQGGGGISRLIEDGKVFERGGVNFSHVMGEQMPASATAHRPELAGRRWEAMGVSLVIHPRNPYCPTSHMNVRFFVAEKAGEEPVWWFGGGMDLTPYYGFLEHFAGDAVLRRFAGLHETRDQGEHPAGPCRIARQQHLPLAVGHFDDRGEHRCRIVPVGPGTGRATQPCLRAAVFHCGEQLQGRCAIGAEVEVMIHAMPRTGNAPV